MQTPERTDRIETFGELVLELNRWNEITEYGDNLSYIESKFMETLDAIREYRTYLLQDLDTYFIECKKDQIPIDLSYYRIYNQLKEATFEL